MPFPKNQSQLPEGGGEANTECHYRQSLCTTKHYTNYTVGRNRIKNKMPRLITVTDDDDDDQLMVTSRCCRNNNLHRHRQSLQRRSKMMLWVAAAAVILGLTAAAGSTAAAKVPGGSNSANEQLLSLLAAAAAANGDDDDDAGPSEDDGALLASMINNFMPGNGGNIAAAAGGDCPRQCSCLGNVVDCSEKGLKRLFPLPTWVENLELSANRLGADQVQTQVANLSKLQVLNLNHNNLGRIPNFRGLNKLLRLLLANNGIDSIELEALQVLASLRVLDLSRNNIKDVQFLSFPAKNNLQFLNLNFNKLTVLGKGTFQRLSSLKRLEINSNLIEEVQSLTFQNLNQVKSLKMNNNRITNLLDGVFHGFTTITTLELNNNSITSIRKGGLFNLTSLTNLALSKNAISEIEQDGWEFAPRLVTLDLSHNRLESLDKNTFEELSQLRSLNLEGNQISAIGEGTFNSSKNLEELNLGFNRISWTIEDMRGPFFGLAKLEKLYLNSNEIKSVSRNAFIGLKSLTLLELSQNNISSIQSNAFKDTVRLTNLIMNSTNLLCDCNLAWFYAWIKERQDIFQLDAECSYPIWLRGQLIRSLSASNFSCYDSPKPHLIDEPKSQLGIRGTNVTLSCTATSTAADVMSFKWKHDNLELPDSAFTVRQINNQNGTVGSTDLTIPYIQDAGAGKYQCIITNGYGVVYSQKVKVTVATYPKFRKTPENISVQSGKMARLACSAVGDPKPQIAWEKDGGNDFPAAKERRMHVVPDEDAFYIVNAQLVDMGIYTCTAENPAGVIRASAQVEVFESPTLLRPLESKSAEFGKTCVLECLASGYPKPMIHWFKDGETILVTERHFFTAENQLLIIVEADYDDAGDYECRLENEFGSERGSMKLSVIEGPEMIHEVFGNGVSDKVYTGHVMQNRDVIAIIVITVICCAILTSLIWLVIMHRVRKQNGGNRSNSSGMSGRDMDLSSNMEANQENLIVRSGVEISTTPAGYLEFLIPMVPNEATTNVDDDDENANLTNRCYYTVVPKVPPKPRRRAEAESDDMDDDLSSKDSGTGGDCGSATGSTNAHRHSHDDLKCLLQSLNRKSVNLAGDGDQFASYDDIDPDADPRIEPPPPIPPVNATSAILIKTNPEKIVYGDDLPPPPSIVSRMATSQTFPTFIHPSSNTPSSLGASSMEAAVSSQQQPQPQYPPNQVQVNKLYQLLIENPRLLEKPAKYRSKSMDVEEHQSSSGFVDQETSGISSSGTLSRELDQRVDSCSSRSSICPGETDLREAVR
ncbi:leucine-rich repeats and immunoglobulin-like domains protein 2 [Uranotaenia lowii]|uniref:leucine-rich repeats and immunoglobulin-like domains protein 2 n=1 Tax=Uranotaenia lowii TaxID=190385 RepID=UPI0024790627|nr:leucine-rich repeats and immunoglobulin-like domains protein 2 [Uranotaenia lowii]